MRQHQLVLVSDRRQCLRRHPDVGALHVVGHRFAALQQGVAA
jgi:hypothetical protein